MRQIPEQCAVTGTAHKYVLDIIDDLSEKHTPVKSYAEIGVYQGDTAVEVAKRLRGARMQLFDFGSRLQEVGQRLREEVPHADVEVQLVPNSELLYDSYNWSLAKMLQRGMQYDLVFIDGAHSWAHDAFAFLLVDRMITPGGVVIFDDYTWSISTSPTMHPSVFPDITAQYTEEQINTPQVQMIVDLLVKTDNRYEELTPNIVYRRKAD